MVAEKNFRVTVARIYKQRIATTIIRERIKSFYVRPILLVHRLEPSDEIHIARRKHDFKVFIKHILAVFIKSTQRRRWFTAVMRCKSSIIRIKLPVLKLCSLFLTRKLFLHVPCATTVSQPEERQTNHKNDDCKNKKN